MYTKHFGLNMLPFENVPDPAFYFDEGNNASLFNQITDSIQTARGITVLTGSAGSGKTTLMHMIMSGISDGHIIWMPEPPDTSPDLFKYIEDELCQQNISSEKAFILKDIKDALMKIRSNDRKCLLIIDESHQISDDTLNGIRLLNNLKSKQTNLLQIILLGQPVFLDTLNKPGMEPFNKAISSLTEIKKMSANSVRHYISHRIKKAGGNSSLFSDNAWDSLMDIFESGGLPRLINSLCDKSLNAAFDRNLNIVDTADVHLASKSLGLTEEHIPVERTVTVTGRDLSISIEPVEDGIINKDHDSETSKMAQKTYEKRFLIKSIKNHCKSFFRNILSDQDIPDGSKEKIIQDENNITQPHAELIPVTTQNNVEGSVINDSPITSKLEVPSLEWMTIDSRGERPFKMRRALAQKKSVAMKMDEWVMTNSKATKNLVFFPDTTSSSEWVTIDSSGERSYMPSDVTNIKPLVTKLTAAERAKWVRTGRKTFMKTVSDT